MDIRGGHSAIPMEYVGRSISSSSTKRSSSSMLKNKQPPIRSLERDSGISDQAIDDDEEEEEEAETENKNSLVDGDEEDEEENGGECRPFENKSALSQDLRFVSGMPELCDVTFVVGEERQLLYGVKAVLAIRSRVFYKILYGPRGSKPKIRVNSSTMNGSNCDLALAHQNSNGNSNNNKRYLEKILDRQLYSPQQTGKNISSFFRHPQASIRAMTTSSQGPSTSGQKTIVHIEEFDADVFKQLLEYVHTGYVVLRPKTLLGLLNAADHFALEELRRACAEYSQKCINIDTVCSLLVTAERYIQYKSSKIFVQRVLGFVDKHGDQVLQLNDFVHLPRHVVELILSREELLASEMSKFRAALRWSRHYLLYHPHETTLRNAVSPFIQYMAFHLIPAQQLMQEIRPLDVVPDKIMMDALAYQADPCSVKDPVMRRRGGCRKAVSCKKDQSNKAYDKVDNNVKIVSTPAPAPPPVINMNRSRSVDRNLSKSSNDSSNSYSDSGFHDYSPNSTADKKISGSSSRSTAVGSSKKKAAFRRNHSKFTSSGGATVVRIEPIDPIDNEILANNNADRTKSCYDLSELAYFTSVHYKF